MGLLTGFRFLWLTNRMTVDLRTLTERWSAVEAAVKATASTPDLSVDDQTRRARQQLTVDMAGATERLFRDSGKLLDRCSETAQIVAMDPTDRSGQQRQIAKWTVFTLKQVAPARRTCPYSSTPFIPPPPTLRGLKTIA